MDTTTGHDRARAARRIAAPLLVFGALLTLAACAEGSMATTSAVTTAAAVAEPAKPARAQLSATQINEQCWMKYESNRADIDKRMKLVSKCVDDKTKEQQGM